MRKILIFISMAIAIGLLLSSPVLAKKPTRARGDARPDSDYDLLVLVEGDASRADTWRIRNAVYDVELRSGVVISTLVRPRERWDSPEFGSMPFHRSVMEEGIAIHG